ncbi:MAG: YicC family protein, partial [Candidatus Latescibacterota bacterium]
MLKSMTGFGVGEFREEGMRASVEVRCWNHRF